MSIPSPEHQLTFLRKIQRLFTEGEFSATYKFALLMALADLAVRTGQDSDDELWLSQTQIAEEFARYYWPQTAPYISGADGGNAALLVQNRGTQAAVVNHLSQLRSGGASTLDAAHRHKQWTYTIKKLAQTVYSMPVTYLQNVGGEADYFLFDLPRQVREPLVLKPGVAYCLRRFHGFIHELARAGWVNHVRTNKQNQPIIGPVHDLESYMFGTPRQSLQTVAHTLRPMQNGACFYCGSRLQHGADVDHFIPWSRYPQDTAHNFVLAHRGCNNDKRDLLAATDHLEYWMERNEQLGSEIEGQMGGLGFSTDLNGSVQVARWAYQQGLDIGAHGWLAKGQIEKLGPQCIALLA